MADMQQSSSSATGFQGPILNGVIRFNVGGTVIEMSREMLELYPKSLLRELANKCPEGAEGTDLLFLPQTILHFIFKKLFLSLE